MNRRTFIRGTLLASTAAASGGALYSYCFETHHIEQQVVPFKLGLAQPLRVVAIGDIHFDPLFEEEYIQAVTTIVSSLNADLVLYTGDFVTRDAARFNDLVAILSRTSSRLGSFAIYGNHDHWAGSSVVMKRILESHGIRLLRNESVALPNEDHVFLTGLDSYWAGAPDPTVIARTPENSRHIVLVHEPDPFAELNDPRIKLQISGHTHGGQVRMPLLGAIRLPKWGKIYDEGLYTLNGRSLYVNRGIGTIVPHVRFDCRPEITVFELT